MEAKVFKFSESIIKERKKITLIIQVLGPIFIIILVFVIRDFIKDIKMGLSVILLSVITIETVLILQSRMMFKRIKETEIIVNDISIQRKSANYIENIEYKNITKVLVREKRSGEVQIISISTPSTSINIAGFENMGDILECILQNVPSNLIKFKKNKMDLDNRLVVICSMIISSVFIISIMKSGFHDLFDRLFQLTAGSLTLIFRPISKNSGLRFKKMETTLGILLIVLGLISFINRLY